MDSRNFEFLRPHNPELADLRGFAEHYAHSDPASALVKLRLFGKNLVADFLRHHRVLFFDQACTKYLPPIIPRGLKIRLVRWHQDDLHNRFILTEYGGCKFSQGLDDHNARTPKHDIVDLPAPEPYGKTRQEYQRDNSSFPLIEDDLIIAGTA